MKVFCKNCGNLLAEDIDIMLPEMFKKAYTDVCPSCRQTLSNYFNVKQSTIKKTLNIHKTH